MPIMRGCTPALAQFTNLPIGVSPNSFIIFSLITITKAAPSLVCELLPAVTVPFTANADFNFESASKLVSALTPSSVSTIKFFVLRLPFSSA